MKKFPLVSLIITNYNGGNVLIDCIKSVRKINYPNFEVILVDNASVDDSIEKALKIKGNLVIKTLLNKKDIGFTGANNRGLTIASGKYILLLNNDTTVDPELLIKFVERFEEDPILGVAQSKIHMMVDPRYLDNAGSFLTRTGFMTHWGFGRRDSNEYKKERKIFSAKGACMFIRRDVIDKVGLFDGDFVSYVEESDFCWRAWLVGYQVIFYPKTYIYHKVGHTFSKQYSPISVNYNSFKNRILSLYKNLETKNLFFILIPHLLIIITLAFYYLVKLQFGKFWMIIRAIYWNVVNLPNTIKKRIKVQLLRVQSDDELFKIIMKKFDVKEMLVHFRKVEANFK